MEDWMEETGMEGMILENWNWEVQKGSDGSDANEAMLWGEWQEVEVEMLEVTRR